MSYNGSKLSNCALRSGLGFENALCTYDPLTNSYQSSSGIDINQYEKNESFNDVPKCKCNKNCKSYNIRGNINGIPMLLILFIIIIIFYLLLKNNNNNNK